MCTNIRIKKNWNFTKKEAKYHCVSCVSSFRGSFNDDISKWNTSQVTDMSYMFGVGEDESDWADVRSSSFNQPIGTWNTSQVTNMSQMFFGASSFNQPIATWNTSQVTRMWGMFHKASSYSHPKPKGAEGCRY